MKLNTLIEYLTIPALLLLFLLRPKIAWFEFFFYLISFFSFKDLMNYLLQKCILVRPFSKSISGVVVVLILWLSFKLVLALEPFFFSKSELNFLAVSLEIHYLRYSIAQVFLLGLILMGFFIQRSLFFGSTKH